MIFEINPVFKIDFYKSGHYKQYPVNTTNIYSNFTPRNSRDDFRHVLVMGVQKFIMDLADEWDRLFFKLSEDEFENLMVDYQSMMDMSLYKDAVTTEHLRELYSLGYLPLEIRSIPEGELIPVGIPVLTVTNTHHCAYWLPNYIETTLSCNLWKPITSATTAFRYRLEFERMALETGSNKDFVKFQGHDFSYRGMSNDEDAMTSGLAFLSCFKGTDTIPAILAAEKYYGANWKNEFIAGSVVATEHSVMCSGGQEDERGTYERLLKEYPKGVISVVSDTWDYWNVISNTVPSLKEDILNRDGKLVIRPDSGNPVNIICGSIQMMKESFETLTEACEFFEDLALEEAVDVLASDSEVCGVDNLFYLAYVEEILYKFTCEIDCVKERGGYTGNSYYVVDDVSVTAEKADLTPEEKGTVQCLWETFGGTINDKGYKVLDSHIGVIYGEAITLERQRIILQRLETMGFASENVVFGIGSYQFQYKTRDSFGFAMKATNREFIEEGSVRSMPLSKDPKTSGTFSKKSAKGYLKVDKVGDDYILEDGFAFPVGGNGLKLTFLNGELKNKTTLNAVRGNVDQIITKLLSK